MKSKGQPTSPYWNPILETLPLEEMRKLQVKKFRRIVKWAYERSKFHRKLYQEAGLKPGDIRSYDDIASRILASAKMLEINAGDLLDLKILR